MSVRIKLTVGFLVIISLLWAIIIVAQNTYTSIHQEFEALEGDILPGAITMGNMENAANEAAHELMDYAVFGEEENKQTTLLAIEDLEEMGLEHLQHETHIGQEEQKVAEELLVKINVFNSAVAELIDLKEQGVSVDEVLKRENETIHPSLDSLVEQLKEHKATHMKELTEAEYLVSKAVSSGVLILFLVGGLTTLLAVTVRFFAVRSIVNTLQALHKGTEIIGQGNLDYKVGTKAKDEIGQLSRAFDQMTENLKKSTTSIDNLNKEITERKQAEEEREALLKDLEIINRRLEESNRELQDFVYVASHDLREPLRKINSFGTLLQDSLGGKLDEDQQENFEFMIDGSKRMQTMIDDLLLYSRVTTKAKPFQQVNLNNVIEDLKTLELAALLDETKGIIHVPEILPRVRGDSSQIHQLFQNLVANGLKFHREGVLPEITIRAHRIENNMVRVEVQDNGIGIDEAYHEQIFTMFKRLHSRMEYQGTGIGLAVCKKIVQRHGGEIGIESTRGEGSIFWFTLPSGSYSGND